MRFLHISDLHFGKSIYECQLVKEDQPAWVDGFLSLADSVLPDAVVIAGDVYDRSAPSDDAVRLLDRLITGLSERKIPVLTVAGNHDSGSKLSFASRLLERSNVHIAGIVSEKMEHVTFEDEHGKVTFWLMPYIFPTAVAGVLGDDTIHDFTTAVKKLLERQDIDLSERNVIVAHQNVVCNGEEAKRGGSETMVGGVGGVDYTVFDGFEYAALGHIHSSYPVGREAVRYAGSPLCYHFNETRQRKKGPLLVELGAKGEDAKIEPKYIEPLHPMREIKGTYSEALEYARSGGRNEYVKVILTDEKIRPEISESLRAAFGEKESVVMEIVSEAGGMSSDVSLVSGADKKSVDELFSDFFTERNNGEAPDDKDMAIIRAVARQVEAAASSGNTDENRDSDAAEILKLLMSF